MASKPASYVLVTGVTGFLGSSLAARLLKEGYSVLALSRNDPQGSRTRSAIEKAAEGFLMQLPAEAFERLKIQAVEFDNHEKLRSSLEPYSIDHVWHVAAEMTYSNSRMHQSFRSNVVGTCQLYRIMTETHPECRRFYYCSTAYSKGINSFDEEGSGPHIGAEVVNPYQASKWVAELNLEALSRQHSLPVTIFRPSIIVGHETSGWSGRTVFGPYGIMMALYKISRMGFNKYKLDLPRTAVPNCIPVNRVVDAMFGLSSRSTALDELEFFNCTATSGLSMEEWTKIIERHLSRSIEFGQGQSLGDHFVNKVIRLNRDFIDKTWLFDSTSLTNAIPSHFQPYHLDQKTCECLVSAFTKELPALSKSFGGGRKRGLSDTLRNYAGLNIRYEKVPIKFADVVTMLKRFSS